MTKRSQPRRRPSDAEGGHPPSTSPKPAEGSSPKEYQTSSSPLVEVHWLDALAVATGTWTTLEEALQETVEPSIAVGYMIKETDEYIVLIALANTRHVAHGIVIPKVNIQEITYLSRP